MFEGVAKTQVSLFIAFVIFLVVVIISGRILNELNLTTSSCKSDNHIKDAHKWAAWAVGISSTGAGLCLIGFIALFFIEI
jgi:ABC-type cobalamin transport system permease subunit